MAIELILNFRKVFFVACNRNFAVYENFFVCRSISEKLPHFYFFFRLAFDLLIFDRYHTISKLFWCQNNYSKVRNFGINLLEWRNYVAAKISSNKKGWRVSLVINTFFLTNRWLDHESILRGEFRF